MGFTVLIVGGSVSGLSLANMLEKFEIEYTLLEGHETIAPQLGASLGLLPSGLCILEQLGCYEKIRELVGKADYTARMRFFSGKHWIDTKKTTFSESLEDRVGYPQIFIDRSTVLQILFDALQHKHRVLTNKCVESVEHGEKGVTVWTRDGCQYRGDILIGADGVHSTVRQEMWRIAREAGSNIFSPDPLSGLQCDSKCIFGISKRPPGLPTSAHQINAFFKNSNYMVISAPKDRYYWFLFAAVDKVSGRDIGRFTKEDEMEFAKNHFADQLTETTTFQDLYERRLQTSLVNIEDHVFPCWHFRRILTTGDAAHKMHPISAQGGNGALETAAALVNSLVPALMARRTSGNTPGEAEINAVFAETQKTRFQRAVDAVNQGRQTNAASIKETFLSKIFVDYFFPRFGQSLIFRLIVKNTESATYIRGLPLPRRYTEAAERHNRRQCAKATNTYLRRSLLLAGVGMIFLYLSLLW